MLSEKSNFKHILKIIQFIYSLFIFDRNYNAYCPNECGVVQNPGCLGKLWDEVNPFKQMGNWKGFSPE